LEVDGKFSVLARRSSKKIITNSFLTSLHKTLNHRKIPFYLLAKIDFHFSSVDFEISFVRGLRKFFVKNCEI
jgi:hypothetical protein